MCTFPHDKIYSILGLCSPLASTIMHPNYSQPVQKIYSQVVKYFAEGIGSLDLLAYSQYSDSMSDLPSWTPDQRQPPRMLPFNLIVSDSISEWHFAALRRFRHIFTEDLFLMKVSSIRYGLIIGTKLEVEFIPGIRIEEWSEYEDENGVSTLVALRRNWDFGSNSKDLVRPLLKMFPADSKAWGPLRIPSTLLLMFILQQPSVLHEAKVLRPAFWKRPLVKQKSFSEAYSELRKETRCRI